MLNKAKLFIISLIIGAIVPSFLLFNTASATDYSASITTSGDVELITVGGQTIIDHSDVNVVTNCRAGYNLSLGTTVNDNNLYLDGDSSNNATNTYITPSNGTSALKDAPNTWGYFASFGASPIVPTENNIFSPVPTLSNDPATIRTSSETASASDIDDDFSIYYGANIRSGMQSGTYTMVPENPLVQDSDPGRLSYYLTMDMSCVSNVDVSFNKNLDGAGGESDPGETVSNFPTSEENIIDTTNQTITLSSKRPLRTGYQFKEWNTAADGSGNYYYPSDTVPIATTTETGTHGAPLQGLVTLYAIWVEDCASATVCYDGNHQEAGTMNTQSINAGTTTNLIASNFSRAGFGFTGWNTEADGTGTQYGPNQNFTMPSSGGVNLYAQWLAPSGTLQSWSGTSAASNMNVGDVLALEDDRDGEVYMVAKLADGNIWITENLRLLPNTATITNHNTNHPTNDFISGAPSSSSSTGQCSGDNATCVNQINYNAHNLNRSLTPAYDGNTNSTYWYSYGVMYNWYTATAGNGTYELTSSSAVGDLCPAGWHLPSGGASGEWGVLASNMPGNNGTAKSASLRSYPNNFLYSGDYNPSKDIPDGVGKQGRIWSTTPVSSNIKNAYRMGYNSTEVTAATSNSWNKWDNFAIRCIYQGGNVPYNDVEVDFEGTGITSLTFTSQGQDTEIATPQSPTISLAENVTYDITATLTSGYEVASWATSSGGTLGNSTTTNPAPSTNTYTITSDATLTVTGQLTPIYTVTTTLGEHVSSISFMSSDYGTETITPASSSCTANQDNTYTCTVDLRRGIEYTISGTYESGYSFDTWATGAGGTLGDATSSVTTYTITSATTLSLTAKEAEDMTYTLIYHAGSGTDAPASETITSQNPSESFTITNLTPIYYGYTFTGWSETPDANNDGTTVDYVSGDTITITGTSATNTKTLYPVYQAVATCPANNICYYDNGADVNGGGRGTMTNQSSNTTKLIPSNFSRTGYGFAGWTTAENATPFGPNATIDSSLVSPGLVLYAKWVKSEGDLQTWRGCNAMTENQVIALTDTRDNNVYAVAKLADGNCWTIENLRLDPGLATITAQNTHNPTSDFITESTTDDGSGNPVSLSTDTLCSTDNDATCINSIQYNASSINRSLTPNKSASSSSWYSYGIYYNWYTATAGNGVMTTASGASVSGDICPKNWHLPTSTNSGEWAALNRVVNGGVSNADAGLRTYPVNLIWSGDYSSGRTSGYGNGRYWSSTGFDTNNAYRMGHQESGSKGATPSGNYKKWDGFAVRCIRDEVTAEYSDLTVTLPQNIQSITFTHPQYGTETATAQDPVVSLAQDASYTMTATFATGYELGSWTGGNNTTIADTTANPTTIIITGDTTLTATTTKATPLTINYHGNGLTFNNDASTNTVKYYTTGSITTETVTRYSHTSNVNDAGTKSGNYPNDADTNDVITIPGAESLHLKLTYQTESISYDWVSIWTGNHPEYNAYDDYDSGITCGGYGPQFGDDTKTTVECDIQGDTVTIGFRSDSSVNEYYGYYAVITADVTTNTRDMVVDEGTYAVPTAEFAHAFLGWSESQNATTATYTDENDIKANLDADNGDTVDLYAIYTVPYTVTVNLDAHSSTVGFYSTTYGTQQVVNTNSNGDGTHTGTVSLYADEPYTITSTFDSGYIINSWSTTENGILGNTTSETTTYSVDDSATLSLTSRQASATLLPGQDLNTKMKTLAEGTSTSYDTSSSKIKALRMADSLPDGFVASEDNTVSVANSEQPIYIFFDNTNDAGIMYFYTDAKDIYMNQDSSGAFDSNTSLTNIDALANWNTSSVTDMSWMFYQASSLTNIDALENWDTSSVANMGTMFSGASALTNIDGARRWNTGSVTNMCAMFSYASALSNIDGASSWDTSNVTTMGYCGGSLYGMFYYATSLTNIDALANWDTSNVTDMMYLFSNASALTNIDALANWDTRNVTDMSWMFYQASSLTNIDALSNWNTGNVTNMNSMFYGASALTNIDGARNWNTSNATKMSTMFGHTAITNIDALTNWNTGNVTNMYSMFSGARALTNIDGASSWNTGNVTDMSSMFHNASSLTNIDGATTWNTGSVTDMRNMFRNTNININGSTINNWDVRAVTATAESSSFNNNYFFCMFGNGGSYVNSSCTGTLNPNHPTFTNRTGTWDAHGTFIPSDTTAGSNTATVTISFDSHISSVRIGNNTISASGSTISLNRGDSYAISATLASGYQLALWNPGENGVIPSNRITLNAGEGGNTYFYPTGDTTLTATSQPIPSDVTTTVNIDSNIAKVSFCNDKYKTYNSSTSTYDCVTVSEDNSTVTLKQGVTYRVTTTTKQGYEVSSYTATGATITSTTGPHTDFTPSGNSSLTITSTTNTPTHTVTVNMDSNVSYVTFTNPDWPTRVAIRNGFTVDLRDNTPYTATAYTKKGYALSSWTVGANATISSTTTNPTTYTVTGDSTLTVTTQQIPSYNVTVNLDSGSSSVTFTNPSYPTQTVTTNGGTVNLYANTSYTITATTATGYEFSSWTAGANATLGSTTANPTTLTVTAPTTLSVTSQQESTFEWQPSTATKPADVEVTATFQDFSTATCNLGTNGQVGWVKDSRDNQVYKIAKLADGKCWMVENLNLAGGTALGADKTDVTSAYVSSFTTSNNLTKNGNTIVLPTSSTSGFDTNNYSYVYNSGNKTNCGASGQNTPCYSYYSWDAATLGSGRTISTDNTDAQQSICPKGWKLPSTYNGSGAAAEATDFRKLMIGYGGSDSIQTYNSSTTPTGATMYGNIGPGTIPNFLLAGHYYDGSFLYGGSYGFYWSSTSYSNTSYARRLYFASSYVDSANYNDRSNGFSVRCLFSGQSNLSAQSPTESSSTSESDSAPAQNQSSSSSASPLSMGSPATNNATPQSTNTTPDSSDSTDSDSANSTDSDLSTTPDSTNTNPQGVTNITTLESPTSEDDPNAGVRVGLAISTAVATTTAGLLLVFARRNKDDDEEEKQQ